MSTSDQNQSRPGAEGGGTGTAAAPQAETQGGDRGARHGRGRRGRTGGGRHEQQGRPQQGNAPRRGDSTLNMEELRELTELFSAHGLTDFEFENADIRIRLSRNPAPAAGSAQAAAPAVGPAAAMQAATAGGA